MFAVHHDNSFVSALKRSPLIICLITSSLQKIHYCSEKSLEKVLNPVILIMFRLYHIPAVQFAAAVATVQDLIEPIVLVLAVLSRTAE